MIIAINGRSVEVKLSIPDHAKGCEVCSRAHAEQISDIYRGIANKMLRAGLTDREIDAIIGPAKLPT